MPDVSVVLPSYRGAALARRSVAALRASLSAAGRSWEIIVVDDGGGDFSPDEWGDDPNVTLLRLPKNSGKGAAVRHGMLAASGQARVFTDVDLPFGAGAVDEVLRALAEPDVHLVIGDRTLRESEYHAHVGWPRRAASYLFTAFVGTIVTSGFFDTQCGLKGARGDVAASLFPLLRVRRFAFDVELIYIALKHRLRIVRLPVRLLHNDTSSVRLLRDSLQGVVDIFRIRYHQARGWYHAPELLAIARRDASRSAGPRIPEASRA
jgi:dolichyl-phosphate beta-glucosyltransferase